MSDELKIPAGWVLVPREPTEAMLDALYCEIGHDIQTGLGRDADGKSVYEECSVLDGNSLPEAYRAMLASAPPPPSTERGG